MRARVVAALSGMLALLAAAPAPGTDVASRADWVEDGALCLRIAPERDGAGRLRAEALREPHYRLGVRRPHQGCQDVDGAPIAAAALAAHLDALRESAERSAQLGCASGFRLNVDEAQTPQLLAQGCDAAAEAPVPVHSAGSNSAVDAAAQVQRIDPLARWRALRDRLQPDGLRIDGAWDRDRAGNRSDSELHLRGKAHWQGGPHRIELELEHQQRRRDGALRKNQQLGSLSWSADFGEHWFVQTELQAERDRVNIESFSLDYLLTQVASGIGPRWRPHSSFELRLAAQWYRLRLSLLDLGISVYADGPAAFAQAHWRPLPRLSLSADARFARWPDGSDGLDLKAELLFDLSRTTGLGLRREINRNTASLNRADEDDVELFLRYRF